MQGKIKVLFSGGRADSFREFGQAIATLRKRICEVNNNLTLICEIYTDKIVTAQF